MKAVKIIIAIAVVLCLLMVVGLLIFIKTLDVNRFKTLIQDGIGKSMDREVSIKSLSFNFSLSWGIFLDIRGLTIQDQPEFSSEYLLSIDTAHFNIDILPFLTSRKIHIQKIELHSPKVNLIRNGSGAWNLPPLGPMQAAPMIPEERGALSALPRESLSSKPKAEMPMPVGELLVRSICVNDGAINLVDRSVTPENHVPVTQLGVQISNLSLREPFPVKADASLWSTRKNVHASGLIHINAANGQVRIDDLKISTDISELAHALLFESFPSVKRLNIEDKIGGNLQLEFNQMVLGKEGLLMLAAEGRIDGGKLTFKDFPVPMEDIQAHFTFTDSDFEIKTIELPFASGRMEMEGRVVEYLNEQKFTARLNIHDVQLGEISAHVDMPAKIAGRFSAQFTGKGEGFASEKIESNLVGQGKIDLQEAKILDLNILKTALNALSFIPNVAAEVEQGLPEKYKEKLKQKDTDLEDVTVEVRIQDGALQIDHVEMNADGFTVRVGGKMDFLQNVDLNMDLYIAADLSDSMVQAVQELRYFLDDRKQIHIPFVPYSGPLRRFAMYPDVEDISKEIIQNRGQEELRKVLHKALGVEEDEPPAQPTPTEEPPQEPKEVSPEEATIEKILEIIPVFK